jgi:hypothetical protein
VLSVYQLPVQLSAPSIRVVCGVDVPDRGKLAAVVRGAVDRIEEIKKASETLA